MNPNVPTGAAILLDFIREAETGSSGPESYGVIFGFNQGKLPKPLVSMTLDEVEAGGPARTRRFGSSAAGAYQFMRDTLDKPGTLADLEGEMGLTGKELFAPDLQDMMALHLLKRRGYEQFMAGTLSRTAFGLNLAKEWASFPVLAATKGQKRRVSRGQSYYAGDGLNKAQVTPEAVEAILDDVLAAVAGPVATPVPVPSSPPVHPVMPGWQPVVMIGLVALLVFAWQWLARHGAPELSPNLVVVPDGAPIPLDRPSPLFGKPEPGIWSEVGLQILLSFVGPLVSAAATYAVGIVVYWWGRLLKSDFDAKSAAQLHDALERGILAGIEVLGSRASKQSLLANAADYAGKWNAGTVKRFGLSHDDLKQLAAPHLAAAKERAK